MKRFISALLAIIILFSSFAGLNVFSSAKDVLKSSGYCGEQAGTKYDFDSSTGHLFIYGGGIIRSYAFFEHYEIKSIVIGHGVTGINESAFSNCKGLISLTLPNTLKSIGKWAFDDCTSLTKLAIPDSVTSIVGSLSISVLVVYNLKYLLSIKIHNRIFFIKKCCFQKIHFRTFFWVSLW